MERKISAAVIKRLPKYYRHLSGQKVVLVDDLIATGGTIEAAAQLIEKCGGKVVKIIFLMELEGLDGRKKLSKYDVASVVKYPGK